MKVSFRTKAIIIITVLAIFLSFGGYYAMEYYRYRSFEKKILSSDPTERDMTIRSLVANGLASMPFINHCLQSDNKELFDNACLILIEMLSLEGSPAANAPLYTPGPDTPQTDRRVVAIKSYIRLSEIGRDVFPFLIAHLEDTRISMPVDAVDNPPTVGLACFYIIERNVEDHYYKNKSPRETASGGRGHQPAFLTIKNIRNWWQTHSNMTLKEMQIEAVQFCISEEIKRGFVSNEQETEILGKLRERLKELDAE